MGCVTKNQLNILNDGRHIIPWGTSNSAMNFTIASPLYSPSYREMLQTVLSSSVHHVITVNVQSKSSEPQTTVTKFNIKKLTGTSLHQMKHGRKSQIQIDHNLLKLQPKIFMKKSKFLQNVLYQ